MNSDSHSLPIAEEPQDPLLGFEPSIRPLQFTVRSLEVIRSWGTPQATDAPDSIPVLPTGRIHGIATLEKDVVRIIGGSRPPTNSFSFTLAGYSSADVHRSQWRQQVEQRAATLRVLEALAKDEVAKRIIEWHRSTEESLNERPPTLFIGFQEGIWDIPIPPQWSLSCDVPGPVCSAIAEDVHSGRCRELTLSASLSRTLIKDSFMPLAEPTEIGILKRRADSSSGYEFGWIESISWNSSAADPTRHQAVKDNANSDAGEDQANAGEEKLNGGELLPLTLQVQALACAIETGFKRLFTLIAALATLLGALMLFR